MFTHLKSAVNVLCTHSFCYLQTGRQKCDGAYITEGEEKYIEIKRKVHTRALMKTKSST